MPVPAETVSLDSRVLILLGGIAFSFFLRKQQEEDKEKFSPAIRMQQVRRLLGQLPGLLDQMLQQRRGLSLELTRLLRQGPDRYLASALRELQGLAK
jgi:hypothetical protein